MEVMHLYDLHVLTSKKLKDLIPAAIETPKCDCPKAKTMIPEEFALALKGCWSKVIYLRKVV